MSRHAAAVDEQLDDVVTPPTPAPHVFAAELPEPIAVENLEVSELLRSLATPPTGVTMPGVSVRLDGTALAAGLLPDGSLPATPLVVDGFSTTWGRRELLAQPELARGRFQLFDPSRTWAIDRDVRGLLVELIRTIDGIDVPIFRGRISHVKVVDKSVQLADATVVDGSLVTLTCTSILADLANRKPPPGAWPAETLQARRARLLALSAGVLNGMALRDSWQTALAAPDPTPDQKSVLDHIVTLYDSCGADRMSFIGHAGEMQFIPRRNYSASRGLAQLFWDVTSNPSRNGKGVYARTLNVVPPGSELTAQSYFIDAAALEWSPADGVERGMDAMVTRSSVSYLSAANGYQRATETRFVAGRNEQLVGERAATLDTVLTTPERAGSAADDLADFAGREGAEWRVPELHWSTRKTDGFETPQQAALLALGAEIAGIVFIQRSNLPALGIRPIVALIGGSIGYQRGGWEIDLVFAPVSTVLPQHAITWEEIDNGTAGFEVRWYDGDHSRGMHESLTYEDLGYVASGLAVNTIPPDQGFDK